MINYLITLEIYDYQKDTRALLFKYSCFRPKTKEGHGLNSYMISRSIVVSCSSESASKSSITPPPILHHECTKTIHFQRNNIGGLVKSKRLLLSQGFDMYVESLSSFGGSDL
jgi:hypothetical protein